MSPKEEPKSADGPQDPELDATDGGWDPYVTSLLMSDARQGDAADSDEDDAVPVMSFSRSPQRR